MKKILVVLIAVCMLLSFSACGSSVKDQIEKQLEKAAEKIINESGEDIDISINLPDEDSADGGSITIGDGEDELVFEGSEDGMEWPDDKLPKSVPELKGIKVVSVSSIGGGVLIGFEECDKSEAETYVKQIKNTGWIVLMEANESDGGMLMTNNDAAESLMFVWNTDDNSGVVTYTPAE